MSSADSDRPRVIFLHPDLGIGGAERLVIDAALALKNANYRVQFVTNHHDRCHCFPETTNGQLDVTVVGCWLPRSVFGGLSAACAYMRMCYAALYVCLYMSCSIVFIDQISVCIPIVRWLSFAKVLFYCHFPDQLLTNRESRMKRAYRYVLDGLEEWSTGKAHTVLVNSRFTAGVFQRTFRSLRAMPLTVLYPTFNTSALQTPSQHSLQQILQQHFSPVPKQLTLFVSVNRFERKKNIGLAVRAFADMLSSGRVSESKAVGCRLVVLGGYDCNNRENIEHYAELQSLIDDLDVHDRVVLLQSPDNQTKSALVSAASALLYTPHNEHFGIVPLEAMYLRTPVIAMASGGPLETVRDKDTGYLCSESNACAEFVSAMVTLANDPALRHSMGEAARDWVQGSFHSDAFQSNLHTICQTLIHS